MARPKKPPDEVASKRIDLRATPAELAEYERAAERTGQTLSAWIKERLNRSAKRESKRD
jgi:predicted HicB family RNase H-like nuclease